MSIDLFDTIIKSLAEELKPQYGFVLSEEYAFASRLYSRRFRSDYAELKYGILFEYEGLQSRMNRSRHTTVEGFTRDCTKYNLGTSMGFSWLRYTRNHLDKDQIKKEILRTLEFKALLTTENKCSRCESMLVMPKQILLGGDTCLLCEFKEKEAKKKTKPPKPSDAGRTRKQRSFDDLMLKQLDPFSEADFL